MFKASPIFLANYNATKKIVVNQGGTSAGKTYSIMQVLFIKAIYNPNCVITVVGKDIPMLKKGAMRDAQHIIQDNETLQSWIKEYNKTDRIYSFTNGSIMEFSSFENEQDARGGRRDYLYINECNSISYMIYWQLAIRTAVQIFLDYNPSVRFFVHEKIIPLPEAQLIISDHRHNPFLPPEMHDEIEGIKDRDLFNVYARGKTGRVTGSVYRMKKVDKIPEGLEFGFGIDFGYNADRSAIVKVYFEKRDRYYEELLYKSNNDILDEIISKNLQYKIGERMVLMTPAMYIAKILTDNGCDTSTLVWGDHDKSMSAQLRKLNIPFRMARKGPNSLITSISKVKEFSNYYYNSPNIESELETYTWSKATDILTGNEITTTEPVDGYPDDTLAALRYFVYSHSMRYATE